MTPGTGGATPEADAPCAGGTWQRGALEIHHLALGQADATLIVGPSGRTLLVDLGEPAGSETRAVDLAAPYLERVIGCRRLDQVLITHFHADHVGAVGKGGLWGLVHRYGFVVGRLFHRDHVRYLGESGAAFSRFRDYLAGAGRDRVHPEVIREGDASIDLGPAVAVRLVAADGHGALRPGHWGAKTRAPPDENDYSVALVLRFGRFDYFLGGDLSGENAAMETYGYAYHDVETAAARGLPDLDVLRVSHHGSDHSSNATFLAQTDPEVSIVSVGNGNGYGHPRPATMKRLLATSVVYLTERGEPTTDIGAAQVAGTVLVRSADGVHYAVNGDAYVATDPARVDADRDGYFREADPDDRAATVVPAPNGPCDELVGVCPPP